MRKIITFLGIYPKETRYKYNQQIYTGRVFPEALRQFVDYDEMLVFLTEEARENAWKVLDALGDARIRPVSIEKGETVQEMWGWFDKILQHVEARDSVIFDITHGLRSIPFLAFVFAAYLKAARQVRIEAVYYGAYELGNAKTGKPAPVIELSEFITMFDWLAAANQFIYTGNARYLADQLEIRGKELASLSQNVRDIALGLDLLRPRDVAKAASALSQNLRAAQSNLPRPFGVIAQQLEERYALFGVAEDVPRRYLQSQLQMIGWYLEKEHYVHALSMAREWVVSLLCARFELDIWDKHARAEVEFLLNRSGVRKDADGNIVQQSSYLAEWKALPDRKRIQKLWGGEPFLLANLRNDVLHTGFRKEPKSARKIIAQTQAIVEEINAIAQLWGITR